ncbi:MAG TPA: S8 family serine peptidase [Geothrix sp.]
MSRIHRTLRPFTHLRTSGFWAFLVVAFLMVGVLFAPSAQAVGADPTPGSLVVKLVPGLTTEEQAAVIARNGGTETSSVPALRLHVVSVPAADLPAVLQAYKADPQVESAELNTVRKAEGAPSDQNYAYQWALPRIGWDAAFGTVVPAGTAKVALLDTGVDASHPDLAGALLPGKSMLDASTGWTDPSGHGTWMAGIVAASTNNGLGIAGVGYRGVSILPVVVLNASGLGQDSAIIEGIVWAADQGADVILMPFSNPDYSQGLQDALDYAWSKGAVLVAATGNDGLSTPTYPAGGRGVIGVSATDPNDLILPASNFGQDTFLAAPGMEILTTTSNQTYATITGTSASSAMVAGTAAFLKAVDPTLTNGVIVGRMARSADAAGVAGDPNNTTLYGNGRVNFAKALADTSLLPIQPVGVPGGGGPYVGPYAAAVARSVSSVVVGSQVGSLTYGINGSVSYAITINTTGSGNMGSQILTISSLPANVSASFSPASVQPTNSNTNPTSTLTMTTSGSVPAGTQSFTVTVAGVASSNASLVIGKATASLTLSGLNPTYDGTAKSVSVTTNPSGLSGVSVTYDGSATAPTNAGSYAVVATLTNVNYQATNATGTLVIAKAATTTAVTAADATYDGNPHGATASATGIGGLNQALTVTYMGTGSTTYPASTTAPTNAGTYTASATYAESTNYLSSSDSKPFTINKASSSTTVTIIGGPFTYTGSAQTPATVTVTGAGGLSLTPAATYADNINAGLATASYTFAGDANHTGSSDSKTFTIDKASSTTTVTINGGPFTYTGSAQTPATVTVTGAGGLSLTPAATYADNINAGLATASYTFAGDANHTGSSDSKTFTIDKASSTTTVTINGGPFTYTGSAQTPATVTVTGAGGLSLTPAATYADNINAGLATASYTFAGDANHTGSSDSKTFTIDKAPSTTTVTIIGGPFTYTGLAQTPATVTVTGAGGLSLTPAATYADNINAGLATASYTFAGDANHTGSSDSKTFTIDKASSTTTVTIIGGPFTYTGSAQTPATVTVTGAGGLSLTPAATYADNINAGLATASYTFAGDANHTGSSDSKTFTIGKASSTTIVTIAGGPFIYTGLALTPATVTVTGAGGLNLTPPANYANNINVGTATASYTFAGDANHNGSSDSKNFTINYGFNGLLAPWDPSKSYKIKSAIPLKWQYTNASGVPVPSGSASPVISIVMVSTGGTGSADIALEDAGSSGYQYDSTTATWQFNWKTTGLTPGTYLVSIRSGATGQVNGTFAVMLAR